MNPSTIFSPSGIELDSASRNVSYLMGLSDFFSVLFEDRDKSNLMLEANAQTAADIYSKFLQLTSTLSLEAIQTTLGQSIKLVLLSNLEKIGLSTFKLAGSIVETAKIANRPLLPTEILDSGIDYEINQLDGYSTITFARPLDDYSFSQRVLPDGSIQYAIWMVNVTIDEGLVQKYFGNLLSISPQSSSEQFSNFIYGLYYIYLKGPTLSNIERGANLVLGIPLIRDSGVVLDIRNYLDTDLTLVITDTNQYLLPEGVAPIVSIGQAVEVGDLLAKVVEIQDSISNDQWWLNLHIPTSLIPLKPPSQTDRLARVGTTYFDIMRDYLAKHCFLVKINVGIINAGNFFYEMLKIIQKAKPAYTNAIYTWRVQIGSDTLKLADGNLTVTTSVGIPLAFINANAINTSAIG